MKSAEIIRASNRAILNSFFNGEAPWTDKEATDNGILINYNDKQGANLLHQARNQYENAFSKTGYFFKVQIPDAPPEKQNDWSNIVTREINRVMKNSRSYYYTQDSVWGGVVLHGIGAKMWWDEHDWKPSFAGVQDILMPTDTDLTMENLRYFAVRRSMKPGKLFQKTFGAGKTRDKGWNMKKVTQILDSFKELNTNPRQWDWSNNPEQMTELYKQNASYYDGDTAPMIWMWDFYHLEEDNEDPKKNGWHRQIILDKDCKPVSATSQDDDGMDFVYDSKKPFGSTLDQIIHFQFGDGNNVPPFKYHSIRSLAWLVYDVLWTMNRLNCQFTQHVFEQMMLLFRVQDPTDRDRLQKLILSGIVGVIPEGLNMVTAQERYQVNTDLVQGLLSNLKQRVGESSSQYTQAIDNGTQKERTKYEVQAVLAQASALMASMLGRAYRQEHFACVEIARRFTKKNNPNFDVKKFRSRCVAAGVDEKYIDSDRWEIEVEQVLGNGNRMLEIAEATELMNRLPMFDPGAQNEIKHDFVLAVTNNPKKAGRLAPLEAAPQVTDDVHDAQLAFGTLMLGVDMQPQEGVNHVEQVETLLRLMGQKIQSIMSTDGTGTQADVVGLQAVARYIGTHVQIIAQNPDSKPQVKEYTDVLGKFMNEVRAMAQRQEEAAQQAQQQDPEVMKMQMELKQQEAEMALRQQEAQQGMAQSAAEHQQKMQQSQQEFAMKLEQQRATHLQDMQVQAAAAVAKTQNDAMQAAAGAAAAKDAAKTEGES